MSDCVPRRREEPDRITSLVVRVMGEMLVQGKEWGGTACQGDDASGGPCEGDACRTVSSTTRVAPRYSTKICCFGTVTVSTGFTLARPRLPLENDTKR